MFTTKLFVVAISVNNCALRILHEATVSGDFKRAFFYEWVEFETLSPFIYIKQCNILYVVIAIEGRTILSY